MKDTELRKVIEDHQRWLARECSGWEKMRAVLTGADLRGADLRDACLRDACLRCADLRDADLSGAYLRDADLRGADLRDAYLRDACLSGADLRDADLSGAYLRDAYLRDAKCVPFIPMTCPDAGDFIAWKKASDKIVKLLIPSDAKRSSATGRICRSSKAKILSIENVDGTDSGLNSIESSFDKNFIYRIGETVEVNYFCEDRFKECAAGIHFFINRQEAVDY